MAARLPGRVCSAKNYDGSRLFARPGGTYQVDADVLDGIAADLGGPLRNTARQIPPGSVVLDIGAGSGILPQLLARMNNSVQIDGLDSSPDSESVARRHYRNYYCQDAESFIAQGLLGQYDIVTLNDVIEHMPNPADFLAMLVDGLREDSRIVVTTPNIAYAGVRLALWRGHFEYVDSGILERTHLRFFTRSTLLALFGEAGLHVHREISLERSLFSTEFASGPVRVSDLLRLRTDESARVYQFLFVLSRQPAVHEQERAGAFTSLPEYSKHRARSAADALAKYARRAGRGKGPGSA